MLQLPFTFYFVKRIVLTSWIVSEEHLQCLKRLNPYDCKAYRQAVLLRRHEGTCLWLFSDSDYKSWIENDDQAAFLWISATPGSGKTVLASVVSQHLEESSTFTRCTDKVLVAYFFFDDKDDRLRNAGAVLQNILAQLLRQDPVGIYAHFAREPEYMEGRELSFAVLWRVFEQVIKAEKVRPLRIVIDALDECDQTQGTFLKCLGHLLQDRSSRVKVFATSRPNVEVQRYVADAVEMSLNTSALQKDITNFIRAEAATYTGVLEEIIGETLVKGADGMFLWASLMLEELRDSTETRPNAVRDLLAVLPRGLPALYASILGRIDASKRGEATKLLQWVVWAWRPLKLRELRVAIALPARNSSFCSFVDDMHTDLRRVVRSLFGSLIRIDQDDTVHLIHQSLKDYLTDEHSSFIHAGPLTPKMESHLQLAVACLSSLLFDDDRLYVSVDHYDNSDSFRDASYFIRYASSNWCLHLRRAGEVGEGRSTLLEDYFVRLTESDSRLSIILESENGRPIRPPGHLHLQNHHILPRPQTTLELAAFLGLTRLCQVLASRFGVDKNTAPLQLAILSGQEAIVRLLIEAGADVNHADERFNGIPLDLAIQQGHMSIFQLLIEAGAICGARNSRYENIQSHYKFHSAISRERYKAGAHLAIEGDSAENDPAKAHRNWVALCMAVRARDKALVQLLIQRGVNLNLYPSIEQPEPEGIILQAIKFSTGKTSIVRLLIQSGADLDPDVPKRQMSHCYTALPAAAFQGYLNIVVLLLDNGACVNSNKGGDTALFAAARYLHKDVVRLLVQRGANAKYQSLERILRWRAQLSHRPLIPLWVETNTSGALPKYSDSDKLDSSGVLQPGMPAARGHILGFTNDNETTRPPNGNLYLVAKQDLNSSIVLHLNLSRDYNRSMEPITCTGHFGGSISYATGYVLYLRVSAHCFRVLEQLVEHGADVNISDPRSHLCDPGVQSLMSRIFENYDIQRLQISPCGSWRPISFM